MKKIGLRGLKFAEIVTFLISLGVLGALFWYLIGDLVKEPKSPFLNVQVTIQKEKTQKKGNLYVFPVVVRNLGHKTPSVAVFVVTIEGKQSQFEVEYLTAQSEKIVYLTSEEDPTGLHVRVVLSSYQL